MPKKSFSDKAYFELMTDLACLRPTEEPPGELFHYTSASGLLGILGSNQIWATNVEFMNDLSEVKYGKQLFLELIQEEQRSVQDGVTIRLLEAASQAVQPFTNLFGFYAVSFCADGGDRLSQWRAYATEGAGYSIGFQTADLLRALTPKTPGKDAEQRVELIKVIYEREEQETLVRSGVKRICNYIQKNLVSTDREKAMDSLRWLPNLLCIHFFPYLFSFKDAAFVEEKEWRLVTWIPSSEEAGKVEFRASGKFTIPYFPLNVLGERRNKKSKLPISKIIQGPRVEGEIGMKSLELIKRKHGYSNIQVVGSKIPLR